MSPTPRSAPKENRIDAAVDEVLDEAQAEAGLAGAVDDVLDEAHGAVPRARVATDPHDDDDGGEAGAPGTALARARETPGWAEKLVRFLDDGLKIPGTNFGVGADALIGLVLPGVGDMVTGTGSLALLFLALKERVPTVILGRMVVNIAIDSVLGSFPVVGDVFDLFFKANRMNLELIEKYRDDPDAEPSALDYTLVGIGVLLVALSIALPFIAIALLTGAGYFAFDGLFGN